MINFFKNLFKVNGTYSLKRLLAALFALIVIISWVAQQFFLVDVPEYMFRLLTEIFKTLINE